MKKITFLRLITFLVLLFAKTTVIGQNTNLLQKKGLNIVELFEGDFQNTSKINAKSSSYGKSSTDIKEGFFSLKKNLKPTIYIENNRIKKVSGDTAPLILKYENSYSLEILNENNSLIKEVELITIKLKSQNELNNRFDISKIRGFNNLKYIYIQCNFKCTSNQISSFILNVDPKVAIFYMVNNPS
tara:strand:- start:2838 stop:3395 length:558 start_codon:yes stop_codon:yes gene_type:complete